MLIRMKKGYLITWVLYFFVIQCFIIWALRGDSHFYTLWGINLLVLIIIVFWASVLSSDSQEKKDKYPIVTERMAQERVSENKVVENTEWNETSGNETPVRRIRDERISESNIEYIKTKINRTKRKPLAEGSPLYRFLVFLLALLGFWWILYIFWKSLDFIAAVIWALAMLIFIGVCFKAWNIWRKSLFSSIYFWFFLLLMLGWILWLIFSNNSTTENVKEEVSVFFDWVKWEEVVYEQQENKNEWFLFEETGSLWLLTGDSLSWEDLNLDENLSWEVAAENQETINEEPTVTETVQPVAEVKEAQPVKETKPTYNPSAQVKMIDAIKHLITAYNIPLSKSTSSKFTYVSKSNADYPYMKTALEKKMIGTSTDPNMIVSCEVYMVMKGLAENWWIPKSDNLKNDYWNMAEARWLLNGCEKWAKVTYANL